MTCRTIGAAGFLRKLPMVDYPPNRIQVNLIHLNFPMTIVTMCYSPVYRQLLSVVERSIVTLAGFFDDADRDVSSRLMTYLHYCYSLDADVNVNDDERTVCCELIVHQLSQILILDSSWNRAMMLVSSYGYCYALNYSYLGS